MSADAPRPPPDTCRSSRIGSAVRCRLLDHQPLQRLHVAVELVDVARSGDAVHGALVTVLPERPRLPRTREARVLDAVVRDPQRAVEVVVGVADLVLPE